MRTFWDGFDTYADTTQLDTAWQLRANAGFTAGRFGGQACRITGGDNSRIVKQAVALGATEMMVGSAIRINSLPQDNKGGLRLLSGADTDMNNCLQCGWRITPAGQIVIFRGSSYTTLWASDEGIIDIGAWHYIGFGAVCDAAAGKVKLALDGEPLVELTGQNTKGLGGTAEMKCIRLGASYDNVAFDWDDIFVDDSYDSPLVERRVEVRRPNADGGNLDLVPSTGANHYAVVDETLADAADYLAGTNVGEYDELEIESLGNVPIAIDGIKVVGYGLKTDATTRAWNYGLRSNGVDALGDPVYLNATLSQGENYQLTNPDGDVPWTAATVNAIKLIPTVAI